MANVKVAVRARPLLPREKEVRSPVIIEMKDNSTIISKVESGIALGDLRDASKEFIYDHSYWSVYQTDPHFTSQEQIFGDLGTSVLGSAFEGYNACIFAYGQTGSGKTFTMMGSKESPGLIPRICEGLFAGMKKQKDKEVSYKVDVSYMEIYNEKVRDLLRPPVYGKGSSISQGIKSLHSLKVREHPKTGPYVEGLIKHQVCDFEAIQDLIAVGNDQRVTAATKMNDVSSRSHAIFTIIFNQAELSSGIPSETVSKIHLVDLAGSERASQTGAEGLRLKEGGNINRSLVCLGNVISALAESSNTGKGKVRYIPYRDSTLTWLLKDSLGGNSKTIMVATVSPCEYSYSETMSTLRYASRAKNIVNKPTINEDINVKVIRELRDEIARLKKIINSGDLKGATPESSLMFAVDLHNKEEQANKMMKVWAEKWEGLKKIIEEREVELQSDGVKMTFASEKAHLLGVDEDVFSAGVVLYYLKPGDTSIGSDATNGVNDIVLKAGDVSDRHCTIVSIDDSACLHPINGKCFVNQKEVPVDTPTTLSHGDTLCFGRNLYFRFNNPQEAKKLRDHFSTNYSKSSSSNYSTLWSGGSMTDCFNLDQLSKLEKERDTLRQKQLEIESEYEEKIKKVLEQLETERENKAVLEEELSMLRERKLTASISISSSITSSTPHHVRGMLPDESLIPSLHLNLASTITSDQSSIDCSHTCERQVIGQEVNSPTFDKKDLHLEEYPVDNYKNIRKRSDSILQYSVSYSDGDFQIEAEDSSMRVVEGKYGDEDKYLMLETDSDDKEFDLSDAQNELHKVKLLAMEEKEKMKACYEEQLQQEAKEKEKMQKEIMDLELKLQLGDNRVNRRRSYAFVDEDKSSSFNRSKPQYHSHRITLVKVELPVYYLRGTGWSSYHVYEIHITVKGLEGWRVFRTYEQFRDFHNEMKLKYPEVSSLVFPPGKWIGFKADSFVAMRKVLLERYLRSFIAILTASGTPPFSETSKDMITVSLIQKFHSFFKPGPLQAAGAPPFPITASQKVYSTHSR